MAYFHKKVAFFCCFSSASATAASSSASSPAVLTADLKYECGTNFYDRRDSSPFHGTCVSFAFNPPVLLAITFLRDLSGTGKPQDTLGRERMTCTVAGVTPRSLLLYFLIWDRRDSIRDDSDELLIIINVLMMSRKGFSIAFGSSETGPTQ